MCIIKKNSFLIVSDFPESDGHCGFPGIFIGVFLSFDDSEIWMLSQGLARSDVWDVWSGEIGRPSLTHPIWYSKLDFVSLSNLWDVRLGSRQKELTKVWKTHPSNGSPTPMAALGLKTELLRLQHPVPNRTCQTSNLARSDVWRLCLIWYCASFRCPISNLTWETSDFGKKIG